VAEDTPTPPGGRIDLAAFLAALELSPVGDGTFEAASLGPPGGVVFGGQLMAQAVAAATRVVPDKTVRSLHTVFARAGTTDHPVQIDVEQMHAGRAFASVTVSIRQGDRLCARSLVLLDSPDPDLIRHAPPMPGTGPPADPPAGAWWEVRTVGGVDVSDPEAVGPAELQVWTRFPDAPEGDAVNRALLAYATDGFLIGTAMRPHAGVGQSMAHVSIATTVLTHTLSFHQPVRASEWLLLDQRSTYAGSGRAYGRGEVFEAGGALVASFVQDSMIRHMTG